jgi:hypothetical protein
LLTEIRHLLRPLTLLEDPDIVNRVKEEMMAGSEVNPLRVNGNHSSGSL